MPGLRISLKAFTLACILAARPVGAADGFSTAERAQLRSYAADTWRSLASMVQANGLPSDGLHRAADGTWKPSRYTSPTNIASYLWSVLAAESLELIGSEEAGSRIGQTLSTLERMERSGGFFYNWYDPATAAPLATWPGTPTPLRPFLSSVDNGWLGAALMMVSNARPEYAARANQILRAMDFARFYDPYDPADPAAHPGLFFVGFWPDTRTPTGGHYGLLNTEARIISYVAISRGQVPRDHYYRLKRAHPEEPPWQQAPAGTLRDAVSDSVSEGSDNDRGISLVRSWGGSMFEALMVSLFVPEADWAPASWGLNHPRYVRAQIEFARREAGLEYWGFSPSCRPGGGYQEYGVPALGTRPGGYPARDDGVETGHAPGYVVTPHASFLSLAFAPADSLINLAGLAEDFSAYSPLGFYDAVNVNTGQVAQAVLALDQGMILAAIGNALSDRVMQRFFTAGGFETVIRPLIAPERFPSGSGPRRSLPAEESPSIVVGPRVGS